MLPPLFAPSNCKRKQELQPRQQQLPSLQAAEHNLLRQERMRQQRMLHFLVKEIY